MALAGVTGHVEWRGPCLVVFASILVMAFSGGSYVFGAYSPALRASQGYGQTTLNNLSYWKNFGGSLGLLPGLLYQLAPTWVLLVIGAIMNLSGYLPIYLTITGHIAPPAPGLMCFFIAMGAASQTFATTAAVVSTVKSFPNNRGYVLGLLMSFGGLSGAILTGLHRGFDGTNGTKAAGVVLVLALLPTLISLTFAFTIREVPAGPVEMRRWGFRGLVGASGGLAVTFLVMSLVQVHFVDPKYNYYFAVTTVTLLIVAAVILLVMAVMLNTNWSAKIPLPSAPKEESSSTSLRLWFSPPARGQEHSLFKNFLSSVFQDFLSWNMVLILCTAFCSIGGLQTAMDNLGQIAASLGYEDQGTISMLVSLANISSYAGRVLGGFGSEYAVARFRLPRPWWLTVTQLPACVGHLLIAYGVHNNGGLYAAFLLIGFSLGAQWSVLFTVISDLFGLNNFSVIYNTVPLVTIPACYILNVLVTGRHYDHQAQRQQAKTAGQCMGVYCFKMPFLIITGATAIGSVASLVLACRTSNFYLSGGGDGSAAAVIIPTSNDDDSIQPQQSHVLITIN